MNIPVGIGRAVVQNERPGGRGLLHGEPVEIDLVPMLLDLGLARGEGGPLRHGAGLLVAQGDVESLLVIHFDSECGADANAIRQRAKRPRRLAGS